MSNLIPIEYRGQRVLITTQLAESFGTNIEAIKRNYERNADRYNEAKHFFLLEGQALKDFKASPQIVANLSGELKYAPKLYLWPEKGAWLHAKSLNTDKAWEAYEMLVDDYYAIKQTNQISVPQTLPEALRLAADLVEKNELL